MLLQEKDDNSEVCCCDVEIVLTSTYLGDNSLCQGAALSQLLSEALTHVVIDVVGPQELFESLEGGESLNRRENTGMGLRLQ